MATVSIRYHILHILSAREMTGYELTCALHDADAPILEGDGYLYPVLYMMEMQKLIVSAVGKTPMGNLRRYYRLTSFGIVEYERLNAKRAIAEETPVNTEDFPAVSKTSSDAPSTLSSLPEILTSSVKNRKTKRRFTDEYATHIEDALQGGADETALTETLGDTAALKQALTDALDAFGRRAVISPRVWIISGITLAVVAALVGLYFLWGVFVLECCAIAAGLFILFLLYRFIRVCSKRTRAYRLLKRAAGESGFTVNRCQSALSTVFRMKASPALVIHTGNTTYKIRFIASWRRLRILKFQNPYSYQLVNVRGIAVAPTHPAITYALYFKPKNMSNSLFRLYHTDIAEFDGSFRSIPLYEKRFDPVDEQQVEVLLLSPVPMRATYQSGSVNITVVGGETIGGVLFHDVPGFCEYLRRERKK